MIYAINYDLKKPGQDYTQLHNAIKSIGDWWHYLDSTWLVDTALTADQIWERLSPYADTNDRVLIIGVTAAYAGWLPPAAWEWLRERCRKAA